MQRQSGIAEPESVGSYDPPRAKRDSLLQRWYYAARRNHPRAVHFVVSLGRVPDAAALVVPGIGPRLLGMRRAAAAIATVSGLALLLAIAGIGAPWAMLPVGFLISAHSFGVSLYVANRWPQLGLWQRMFLNMGLAAVGFALLPALIGRALSPVVVLAGDREQVYLVDPRRADEVPQPGERLLVEHEGFGNRHGFRLRSGAYLVDVVLVGPGVHHINGDLTTWSASPVLATAASGEVEVLRLGPSSLLVWPANMRRLASRAVAVEAESFVLDRRSIVGRPYKRWFWRTFEHEPLPQS